MDSSLTVVLPINNAERTLRRDVVDVLEAAAELTALFEVLIVDDGSTDDSYDVAVELAMAYRQVRVMRRSRRKGLTESLREIQASIDSDVVIVHDGASRVNPEQLRLVWKQQQVLGAIKQSNDPRRGVSFADLRRPSVTHPAMVNAHRRLMGFQPVDVEETEEAPTAANQRRDKAGDPQPTSKKGMGAIPTLPKANLFGAITDFAKGE